MVWEVLGEKGGAIYVCGSASRVGKSVKEVVIRILAHFYALKANHQQTEMTKVSNDEEESRSREGNRGNNDNNRPESEEVESSAVGWAEQYLERLMAHKKYCEDVWG